MTETRTCDECEIGLRCLGSKEDSCCRDEDGKRCEEHDGHCTSNDQCSEGLVCGEKTCLKKDTLSFLLLKNLFIRKNIKKIIFFSHLPMDKLYVSLLQTRTPSFPAQIPEQTGTLYIFGIYIL